MTSVSGFVVAGGRSRRMGRDKALLPWGGGTLLDHALERVRAVSDDVRILSGHEVRYADRGVPVIKDAADEIGPLVGVLSGLLALQRPLGVFLAVDLPYVTVALLRHLVFLAADHDVVVPLSAAGSEPLCAVYSKECLPPLRSALARGELKMTGFWSGLRVRQPGAEELRPFGDPARLFLNLNSPDDYQRALS